jgi:outer membrane receptor protein involved in Fe transport
MRACLLFLFIIVVIPSHAHNAGNISGTVSDIKNGTPLIGVYVRINNSLITTTTDLEGKFELKNIKIGNYEVSFSYIGYKTVIQNATVKENMTDTLKVKLEESLTDLSEVTVQASRPISAASSKEIQTIDMQLKPFRTSQDMLLMVPGLYIAQHQGGGLAEQIFLRGFDCDHGTDVSVNVDGMPVNMVTNAHGQGFADLHFLIAETVDEMEVNKGPYLASIGDFYTAGAVNFKTKDILENNLIKVEAGQFNTQKYTLMLQPDNGESEQNGYFAIQYHHTDGPSVSPQKFERMNIFGKYFFQLSPNSRLTFSAGGFSTAWNASGQIPERAVNEGIITRFASLSNNMEGGVTNRKNINVNYKYLSSNGNELEINSFFTQYNLRLFSNFTYFLTDSVNGDMIEQNEHRTMQGLNTNYKFVTSLFGLKQINKIGGGYRGDMIDVQLWHSPNRIRMNNFTSDIIDEQNLNFWFQQEFVFSSRVRMVWGIRHDFFTFSKDDKAGSSLDTINNGLPHASGFAYKSVFSPKVNLVISVSQNFDIFLNFGQGFHSNDARDVIIGSTVAELSSTWKNEGLSSNEIDSRLNKYNFDPAMRNTGTLPKATAGEIGIKGNLSRVHFASSIWYLYLQKEFVYSGDGGSTELSNPTQRFGVDFEARWEINNWLWADADISASKGTINNLPAGQNYIPLAPTLTATGGISVLRDHGFSGAIRFRHLSNRPAIEDNSVVALGHTLFNASLDYKLKRLTFSMNIENILNTDWNEAQFATETRLKGEKASITELCFTPGNPRNIQFGVSYKF